MGDVTFRLRQNLAALLKHKGMTAAELSRATGVAKQVLSDWMAGVQPRKLEQLYLVAKTLDVTLEDLCFAQEDELTTSKETKGLTTAIGAGGGGLAELRGKYEVVFRRLDDQ
jgi:transcriptional regulator with XRE-family HTH domain